MDDENPYRPPASTNRPTAGLWQRAINEFRGLFGNPYEQFLRHVWRERRPLSDDDFYDRFYRGSGIDRTVPSRLRAALESAVGEDLASLHPSDNLALCYEYIDFADILVRLEREFGVRLPASVCPAEIDGTVDSLIRYIAKELNAKNR